jgi:hypothetical protein
VGVAIYEAKEECRSSARFDGLEGCGQVWVGGIVPGWRSQATDGRKPATPTAKFVEGEPEADRIEPSSDVGSVEAGPRPKCLQIRLLGDVLRLGLVAQD